MVTKAKPGKAQALLGNSTELKEEISRINDAINLLADKRILLIPGDVSIDAIIDRTQKYIGGKIEIKFTEAKL